MNCLFHRSKTLFKSKAPTVLSVLGVVGVVATTITAVKATPKAILLLEQAKHEKGEELTKLEVVQTAGPAYIPTTILVVSTITCILGANVLNKRHQAALTSAYALLDSSYKNYKNKIKEIYGEEADNIVKMGIAKDEYQKNVEQQDGTEPILTDNDKYLFFDWHSERYIESTEELVRKAEYQINRTINIVGAASLNDFYEELGVSTVDGGDALGWSSGMLSDYYWQAWVDFDIQKVEMEDGLECYILSTSQEPVPEYLDY